MAHATRYAPPPRLHTLHFTITALASYPQTRAARRLCPRAIHEAPHLSAPALQRPQAGALRNLAADNPENKEAIRRGGGVPPLVRMLSVGSCSLAAQQAAGALANLASNTIADQDAIREAGGIDSLVQLLHAGEVRAWRE